MAIVATSVMRCGRGRQRNFFVMKNVILFRDEGACVSRSRSGSTERII